MALGRLDVDAMLASVSSTQWAEWEAYWRVEPWGELRADLRAGTIAAPLINMQLKRGRRKHKPSEWLMEFGPPQQQSPEVMKALLQGYAAAMARKAKAQPINAPPKTTGARRRGKR